MVWRTLLWLLGAIGLILAVGAWALMIPSPTGASTLLTVEEGESVSEVATALKGAGLIPSANALAAAAYATGKWRMIKAGRHELEPGMSALEILDALSRAPGPKWTWLTIPEGYTLRQIAEAVEEQRLGEAADFLAACRRSWAFEAGFPLPDEGIEGYLFPDTYRVEEWDSADDIISQMLRRFDSVVWQGLFANDVRYNGRTLREVIILASLVEAEAKRDEERAIIAGVLVNRLERGQKLECDATVQYALGENRKARLTYEDLEVESDYNTYLHEGLPPGPICNPGESSIRAAMEPEDVPYMYYVAAEDGSHVFSRTFAEHKAAIARVRRGNR